jgi:hypothetical protein
MRGITGRAGRNPSRPVQSQGSNDQAESTASRPRHPIETASRARPPGDIQCRSVHQKTDSGCIDAYPHVRRSSAGARRS